MYDGAKRCVNNIVNFPFNNIVNFPFIFICVGIQRYALTAGVVKSTVFDEVIELEPARSGTILWWRIGECGPAQSCTVLVKPVSGNSCPGGCILFLRFQLFECWVVVFVRVVFVGHWVLLNCWCDLLLAFIKWKLNKSTGSPFIWFSVTSSLLDCLKKYGSQQRRMMTSLWTT